MAKVRRARLRELDGRIGRLAVDRDAWPEAFPAEEYCLRWAPLHLLRGEQPAVASRLLGEVGFLTEHLDAHEDDVTPIAIWRAVPGASSRLRRIEAQAVSRTGLEWAEEVIEVVSFLLEAGHVASYLRVVRAAQEAIPRVERRHSRLAAELEYERALAEMHNGDFADARHRFETLVRARRLRELQPELLNNLGGCWEGLGDLASARRHFLRAIADARARDGAGTRVVVTAQRGLANVLAERGDEQGAIRLLLEALADEEASTERDPLSVLRTRASLASLRSDHVDGPAEQKIAEDDLREVQRGFTATLGAAHPTTILTTWNLAVNLDDWGRGQEALPLFEEVLRRRKAVLGKDHPDTIAARRYLASTLAGAGHRRKAVALLRDNIPRAARVWGAGDEGTVDQRLRLGRLLVEGRGAKQRQEGEQMLDAVARVRPSTREIAGYVVEALIRLGYSRAVRGDLRAAEAAFRRAVRAAARRPACSADLRADAHEGLARALVHGGRPRAALVQFQDAVRAADRLRPAYANQRTELRRSLAVVLRDLGRHAEAARWFRAALRIARAQSPRDAEVEERILAGLAQMLAASAGQQ